MKKNKEEIYNIQPSLSDGSPTASSHISSHLQFAKVIKHLSASTYKGSDMVSKAISNENTNLTKAPISAVAVTSGCE